VPQEFEKRGSDLGRPLSESESARHRAGYSEELGDSSTYPGIERNTKLILAHKVGKRHETTWFFLLKLDNATTGQFQITTDGLSHYNINLPAV
jgi:hypothetical protein